MPKHTPYAQFILFHFVMMRGRHVPRSAANSQFEYFSQAHSMTRQYAREEHFHDLGRKDIFGRRPGVKSSQYRMILGYSQLKKNMWDF